MRRSKWLIQRAREYTDNTGVVSGTAGISDDEALQFLTDAQEHLFSALKEFNTGPFEAELRTNTVANQEGYTLPPDVLFGNSLVKVEYSHTGQLKDYVTLEPITPEQRDTSNTGYYPSGYLVRAGQVLLSPIPTQSVTNGLRITYIRELPKVAKRLGQVDTITAVAGVISAITIFITDFTDYFPDASAFDTTSILVDDYFCLVSKEGTILAHNIPISAISGSGVCTINGTHVPWATDTGTSITLDASYLVAGANASSHPQLPNMCEKYLIAYAAWEFFGRDGSEKGKVQGIKMEQLKDNIVMAWKSMSADTSHIPITAAEWLWG